MAKAKEPAAAGSQNGGGLVMGLIVPLLVLTAVAGGGGWVVGTQIAANKTAAVPGAASASPAADTRAVRELPPIVTNLAAPEGAWVRLQAAVVYDKADTEKMDVMTGQVVDDTLAFMKTLTLTQLQGASGLQHLREDLNERASLRSDGHIRELMIEMLVVE